MFKKLLESYDFGTEYINDYAPEVFENPMPENNNICPCCGSNSSAMFRCFDTELRCQENGHVWYENADKEKIKGFRPRSLEQGYSTDENYVDSNWQNYLNNNVSYNNIWDKTQNMMESLLVEISLQDHFNKYVVPKYDTIDFNEYEKIAKLDPTSINNQKGKYVDWLLKMYNVDDNMKIPAFRNSIREYLPKFLKANSGKDINSFNSIKDFLRFVDTLPDISKKEQKRLEKDIFHKPNDIKIIDIVKYEGEEYIIAEPLTQEGDIILARWKSDVSAKWCTADPTYSGHWNSYTNSGTLLVILNRNDGRDKYQVWIKRESIEESRDFDDRVSNYPRQILKQSDKIEEEYGDITYRKPFKFIYDEEGTASSFLSDYHEDINYLNREPEEDEYDWYYEEAAQNTEYQINHWDRVIKSGFEIFKDEIKRTYTEIHERMEYFVNFFKSPPHDLDIEEAHKAVYEYFEEFEDEFNNLIIDNEDDDEPTKQDFPSTITYMEAHDKWLEIKTDEYLNNNSEEWKYIQYFLQQFPYDFKFNLNFTSYTKDNSDEQLSLKFEGKNMFVNIIKESIIDREPVKTARLLSFDKVKINTQFKENIPSIVTEFPIEQINNILSEFNLTIIKNDAEFKESDGDFDYDLSTKEGNPITNSVCVVMWHLNDNTNNYNFNIYLT